ncbi:ATP-dependent carboxylate-amine ligase [Streptomyces sp. NPDC048416]|uniref:ATP-grasp domain-containing protein n=1 Tax=Streptomyces sp. NPDC048416 TaxID=3365546 RepID=UPI00371B5C0C
MADHRPSLLLVDGRPGSFTDYVIGRTDIAVTLLRFERWASYLPLDYRERTRHLPTFTVADGVPLEQEAARYRAWAAEQASRPRHFCNPQEPLQEIAQAFAGLAGLPHLDAEQVAWVRHKPSMKDRFAELGVPCAAYRMVRSANDITDHAKEWGWPLILKPVDSFSSIDTFKLDGPGDLDGLPALDGRAWMAEEFLTGKEYQLCALVAHGTVLDAWPSWTPAALLETVDGAMNANVTIAGGHELPIDVREITQRLVDGMRLDHGYLHMEFFLDEDGSYRMSEIGARLAGCEIPTNHGLSYGFDVFAAILDSYLGRVPRLRYSRRRCVGDLLLPLPAGHIRSVTPLDELLKLPGVLAGRVSVTPGTFTDPQRASHASSGYVHVEGSDVAETAARMANVLEHFRVEVAAATP